MADTMKTYKVIRTWTNKEYVEVKATNSEEAYDKASEIGEWKCDQEASGNVDYDHTIEEV